MTDRDPRPAPRIVVIAPTYDNAATLVGVLDAVTALGLPVIAVDDGSTDATPALLAAWVDADAGKRVVTHPINRGKAAALRSGFDAAKRLGYTHAATIDTDGQHDPADLPALLAITVEQPDAIVVGARPIVTRGYPRRSRVGRRASNMMVRLLGGCDVDDSQCGLRVYPLAAVDFLACRSGRYAFETEVLIRAGWANVPVRQTPVRCIYFAPGRRVSHFKPWRDSLSAIAMHVRLMVRALWPVPARKFRPAGAGTRTGTVVERLLRWLNPWPTLSNLRCDPAERERFARSVGVGAFVAMTPPLGFKTFVCLAIAKHFRLQPTVMLAVSSLQTPPVGIPLALVAIHTGHLLLTGRLADRAALRGGGGWPAMVGFFAGCWVLGGVVSGAVVGLGAYAVTRARGAAREAGGCDATAAAARSTVPSRPDTH
jgi:uncharacterized protein (DUF2062 family)